MIYGTSAGAILTAEVAAKIKQLGLPMPAALGIFSGMGDFARAGDSMAMYALRGLAGHLDPPEPGAHDPFYVAPPTPKTPSSRQSTATCTACRRPSLSPAAATCS